MFSSFTKSLALKSCLEVYLRRFSSSTSHASLIELGKKALIYSENEGYVMKSPYGPISVPKLTIDQYIWKNISKWQSHIAIACGVTGRKYTYAKLRDHCAALAIRLRNEMRFNKNDIVAICLPNVPEYVVAFLGSIEGGLTVTTVNPWYTAEEISRQLASCRPKAIFCLVENLDVIKNACKLAQQPDVKVIAIKSEASQTIPPEVVNFTELMSTKGLNLADSSKLNHGTNLDHVSILLYSSGTTGLPKGVMLSHNNLTSNFEGMDVNMPYEPVIRPTTADFQEVVPCFLPFYHIYGLVVLLLRKLASGCKIISIPKYDATDFLRIVAENKATFLHLVPPIVIQLANHKDAKPEQFKYVRQVMSAASTLAQADAERFKRLAGNCRFFQGYGLTETAPICTMTPQDCDNYGSIGWPISNVEMKIVDINDAKQKGLGPNETGQLLVRGPNIMIGYYKNEEATKAMVGEDGWLQTGDIGHYDNMGLFHVSDRIKELIKVNANQVAPAELEGILREHPDILDAVVIGVPHPTCGEVPKAFVARRPESKISEKDVQDYVAKQVIKYKQLTGGIQFVEEKSIPKTLTGKILRREIRKMFPN